MHPLDLVKTRFQLQSNASVERYNGLADCMKKMYKSEGLLSFWKGVVPPILVETPKRAWKFCTFEQFKKVLIFHPQQHQAIVSYFLYVFCGSYRNAPYSRFSRTR